MNGRMTRRGWLAGCGALAAAGWAVGAGAQVARPPRGSPERAAILEALRAPVARAIGGSIEFQVSEIRTFGDWAYVSATPRRPGGKPIDWSRTRFAADMQADMMSDLVLGLLRRRGAGWRVVAHAIGPTDVAWIDWIERHGAPKRVFSDE